MSFSIKRAIIILLPFIFSINSFSINIPLTNWKYHKGLTSPIETTSKWHHNLYNDSQWLSGIQPFQYGEGSEGTILSDMMGKYSSVYLRTSFDSIGISKATQLSFLYDFDDGFILYFNGQEMLRKNAPATPTNKSLATTSKERGESESVSFSIPTSILLSEKNCIAIQLFNASLSSSDVYFNIELSAELPLTVATAPFIDYPGGRYENPFTATITPAFPGDIFYYTLDGSDPARSTTAVKCTTTTKVLIDPKSNTGRGITPGVVLSVKTIKNGFTPSLLVSNTYLFIKEVRNQIYPGGKWPSNPIKSQLFDYVMDEKITKNDPRYRDSIEIALKSIPSLMLTVDYEDLFNTNTGIYTNARNRGADWERAGNLELIDTDGTRKFRVGTGVRIRGGASRNANNPKHSFMLFFKSMYGDSKLKYSMFENEGENEFDRMDLRTSQNYSWSFKTFNESQYNTFVNDNFSRDAQRDMGQVYTRSRFYHLYLNGLYFGLYETEERAEENFASDYLGGNKEDYDIVKVARETWSIEASNGTLDSWREIYDMCLNGFSNNKDYYHILGLDENGVRDLTKKVYIDVENLIDYMLVIFFTGNFDAPVTKFGTPGNLNPNNFYAINDRTDLNKGFVFLAHDAEHSLFDINENRVNIGTSSTNKMEVTEFERFHPQWLHFKLSENPHYRALFADRAYKALYNNGQLTPIANKARLMNRANMIQTAIIAESARWGDTKNATPLNKQDHWIPAVSNIANNYFNVRSNIVITQLKEAGLLPDIEPPLLKNNGILITGARLGMIGSNINISNPNSSGVIIYSLNGEDPRTVTGQINPKSISAGSLTDININEVTHLKARVKTATTWSPLRDIFLVPANYSVNGLRLTEMHYHPLDSLGFGGKELEFIEFKNTGNMPIDMMGISFVAGIEFTYNQKNIIQPGGFSVIASNAEAFKLLYGKYPDGVYNKSLSNGGELININDAKDNLLLSVEYDDKEPWPEFADGMGYSLASFNINPTGEPNQHFYWRASFYKGGSPYADDNQKPSGIDRLYDFGKLTVYPNPATDFVRVISERTFSGMVTVTLHSLNGSIVAKEQMIVSDNNNFEFQIGKYNLQKGIYLLHIRDTDFSQKLRLIIK